MAHHRWKEGNQGEWTGVIGRAVWRLKQSDTELSYKVFKGTDQTKNNAGVKSEDYENDDEAVLRDYLQLDVNLESLYKQWAAVDTNFEKVAQYYTGIRMLRQDPVECLFSFICSSNNHISRISSMVEKLAVNYGKKIMELDGHDYYTFPEVSALSGDGVEEKLRYLGFGYRAKYIQTSARFIEEQGGVKWLHRLRSLEYKEAKVELMKLCGVGAKVADFVHLFGRNRLDSFPVDSRYLSRASCKTMVADCVSLFCCDKPGSIPVDTHVWQIAARDYLPKLKQAKSLTDKLYEEIGDHFRTLWGPYAGWAHSVLFTADLRQFKEKAKKEEEAQLQGKRKGKQEKADVKDKKKQKKPKKGR